MAVMTYREALNEALREEMERDPDVFLMGEEVAEYDGAYKVSKGLLDEFGDQRVVDSPISELGFTGLGVGASRFGARVALDWIDDPQSSRLRLDIVRRRPFPWPPEPLRSLVVNFTRHELARADRNQGRRGLWLKLLDRLGLGFDS